MPPFKLSPRTVLLNRLPAPMIVVALALALVGGFAIHWGVGLLLLAYIVREGAASVWETASDAAQFEYEAYRLAHARLMAQRVDEDDQPLIDPRRV